MDRDFGARLLEAALRKGADAAEVYTRVSKNLTVEVKDQEVDTLETSLSGGYGIRVIRDHRLGFSYSTDLNDWESVAGRAVEASRYAEPDESLCLPVRSEGSSVEIYDPRVVSVLESEARDYALVMERAAMNEDPRITKIRKASGSFTKNDTYIVNSLGVDCHYTSTGCSAQILAIAEEGDEGQMGWDYEGSRFLGEIGFERVGRNAALRAASLLGSRKISPSKGFVLLDNAVVTEFLGILASGLSSEAVQKKKSLLEGKVGERIISPRLHITDSGILAGKLGSRPVDDEGVATTEKRLVEEGVLKGFLYNTYTARKEGRLSTGNAARGGFSGLPTVGPTNLFIEPSSPAHRSDRAGIMKAMGKGLIVTETMGMHTANPITGEFSVGASGLWVEGGEIQYPVKEAVISGTILDLFSHVVLAGDDLRFYGAIGSPSLLIEGIDISA
ncbi:MAG: TldD/PmbA family protein [Nitrospirales bacterium]|nr:TldD/PmbA family protein [Nitrospirales bacterium]